MTDLTHTIIAFISILSVALLLAFFPLVVTPIFLIVTTIYLAILNEKIK